MLSLESVSEYDRGKGYTKAMSQYVEVRGIKIGDGIPKICVPVVGTTEGEILESVKAIKKVRPDIVEWRADWFDRGTEFASDKVILEKLRSELGNIPVLFTFRTFKEGGKKQIALSDYIALNEQAACSRLTDLIDVELFTGDAAVEELIKVSHRYGTKVVVSNHDFEKTPEKGEIINRLSKMKELGADLPKIAVMPQSKKDVLTLLDATQEAAKHGPVITMSMAATGVISRLCGEIFGSALTFGAVGKSSAPGQIDAEELKKVLNIIHNSI